VCYRTSNLDNVEVIRITLSLIFLKRHYAYHLRHAMHVSKQTKARA